MKNKIIKLSASDISSKEIISVNAVLRKQFLGMGKMVFNFEKKLESFFGSFVACTVNGTAALHLALQASGVKNNDEVLVPSITYIASLQAITATGAKPVICDVNVNDGLISLKDAEKKISKKTKAIMPVYFAGYSGDVNLIYKFAKKYKLKVIEDAAHAFGSKYNRTKIGSVGDFVCFSFDGIKNITSGEGGCVVSKNKKIINRIKDLRLLGVKRDSIKRYSGDKSWVYRVEEQGWRYHMSDIMASIGLVQLNRFNKLSKKRKDLAKYYDFLIKKIDWIDAVRFNVNEVVPHIYVIKIKKKFDKKKLLKFFKKSHIEIGLHYYPTHKIKFFNKSFQYKYKNSEEFYKYALTLPLNTRMRKSDIKLVVKKLLEFFK
tara:strand:- start:2 stop:1126 length:1125 start_codon:yes stop_codon:yes gene_type:complete